MGLAKSDHEAEAVYLEGPDNALKIKALKALAKKLGGEIVQLSEEAYEARMQDESRPCSEAPFTHYSLATDYEAKIVYYVDGATPWSHMVHELGHIFACATVPEDSDELDFFGWEYTVASNLNGVESWLLFNRDYSVGEGDDLGTLKPLELVKVLADQVGRAYALGLVVDGQPQSIR